MPYGDHSDLHDHGPEGYYHDRARHEADTLREHQMIRAKRKEQIMSHKEWNETKKIDEALGLPTGTSEDAIFHFSRSAIDTLNEAVTTKIGIKIADKQAWKNWLKSIGMSRTFWTDDGLLREEDEAIVIPMVKADEVPYTEVKYCPSCQGNLTMDDEAAKFYCAACKHYFVIKALD